MKNASCVLLGFIVASVGSSASATIIGTYVDGDLTNTTPGTAITATGNSSGDDLWTFFSNAGLPSPPGIGNSSNPAFSEAVNQSVFVGLEHELVPVITTTVNGLNSGTTYDVYVVYGALTSASGTWGVDAALHGGTLALYSDTNGTLTASGDVVGQYEALVGQVTGVTSFGVDIGNVTTGGRGYYDGVAFVALAPEPGSLMLLFVGLSGLALGCRKLRRRSAIAA